MLKKIIKTETANSLIKNGLLSCREVNLETGEITFSYLTSNIHFLASQHIRLEEEGSTYNLLQERVIERLGFPAFIGDVFKVASFGEFNRSDYTNEDTNEDDIKSVVNYLILSEKTGIKCISEVAYSNIEMLGNTKLGLKENESFLCVRVLTIFVKDEIVDFICLKYENDKTFEDLKRESVFSDDDEDDYNSYFNQFDDYDDENDEIIDIDDEIIDIDDENDTEDK